MPRCPKSSGVFLCAKSLLRYLSIFTSCIKSVEDIY
nr:MAG TPA: hypothetical protein [Caudoviricetes sp.]